MSLKPDTPTKTTTTTEKKKANHMITPQPPSNPILSTVLSSRRSDDVSRIIKRDKSIVALAKKLCSGFGDDKDEYTSTRQNLRRMGCVWGGRGLLQHLRLESKSPNKSLIEFTDPQCFKGGGGLLQHLRLESKSPNKSLIEFIDPQCFRMVCKASRNMANFDASANRYKTPSVAQKIGPMLEKVCCIILTESIERQDKKQKFDAFKKLYDLNWSEEVSANASKTVTESKRKNANSAYLPLADHVKCLSNYLKNKAQTNHEVLLGNPTSEEKQKAWLELCKCVLTQTILFNRCRPGEVSKMTVKDYKSKRSADIDGPVSTTLSKLEKKNYVEY